MNEGIIFALLFFGIVAFEFGRRIGIYDGYLDYPRKTRKVHMGLRILKLLTLLSFSAICYLFGFFYIGYKIGYKIGQMHYFDYRIRDNLSISPTRWHHTV